MAIESIMYFALGLLVAGLFALIIMPAVWKRAVRLTKRRIEAATPITMAEFRADKDQLRAQFALTTRKLELNIEALRNRLADQLADVDRKRVDLGALQIERDKTGAVVGQLQAREAELHASLSQLERDNTDLTQRLRQREGELGELRETLGQPDKGETAATDLVVAEASLASAETQLRAILAETETLEQQPQFLAEKLSLDDELEAARLKVADFEATLLADWNTERIDETQLRGRLDDIAAAIRRLVYATESAPPAVPDPGESLFDRVQRFADDGHTVEHLPKTPSPAKRKPGAVSDRMAALREIQGR